MLLHAQRASYCNSNLDYWPKTLWTRPAGQRLTPQQMVDLRRLFREPRFGDFASENCRFCGVAKMSFFGNAVSWYFSPKSPYKAAVFVPISRRLGWSPLQFVPWILLNNFCLRGFGFLLNILALNLEGLPQRTAVLSRILLFLSSFLWNSLIRQLYLCPFPGGQEGPKPVCTMNFA